MLGKTISHYEILDLLGRGGMGVVYKARDTKLDRLVALKFLPQQATDDDRARARFVQEAQAASALEHPNICVIHEIDETEDGQLFMAMAYYPGESLKETISRTPLNAPEAARIGIQIAQGLAKAHHRSIVHRDIKPANILITEEGHVKIVDFGVAKLTDRTGMTREGGVVGTVAYMSPEQVTGDSVDARSDLWSLGVVLHEMLTGKLPYRGGHEQALVYSILNETPDLRLLDHSADSAMVAIIRGCLERDLRRRWESADRVATSLRSALLGITGEGSESSGVGDDDETAVLAPAPGALALSVPDFGEFQPSRELFVGRNPEIARLSGLLETALSGHGQIALITGEAGQGKTSLVGELCRLAEESHSDLVIGSGKCNAQTGTADPYHPFREVLGLLSGDFQLKGATNFLTAESAERLWKRMPRTVDTLIELGPDLIDTFIPGRPLLSRSRPSAPSGAPWFDRLRERVETGSGEHTISPAQGALFDQYARVIQSLAQQGPLLLLLEDLHWADPGSVELLAHLGESVARCRTLILGTFRHEDLATGTENDRHPLVPIVNNLKRTFGDVEINLDQAAGRDFIDAILDAQPNKLDSPFRDALYRQTGGLPLFTVELLEEMQDRGFLIEDTQGRLSAAPDLDWEVVPARAEAVVAERIERLPEDLQSLLATCSVEGEDFTAEVVAMVMELDPRQTTRLLSSEIAKKHGLIETLSAGRIGGRRVTRYRFRHIFFQRYLYGRLDEVERSFLHEEVGNCLEEHYGERVDEVVLQLAQHFAAAGIPEKTIQYLRQAALSAARLSANLEVIDNLEGALQQLEALPEDESRDRLEFEMRCSLSPALIAIHGFTSPEVEASNTRSQELCERLPDLAGFDVLWGLFAFNSVRADFLKSLPMALQMVDAAEREGTRIQKIQSRYARGTSEFFLGNFEIASSLFEEMSTDGGDDQGEEISLMFAQDSRQVARGYQSLIHWLTGRHNLATAQAQSAIEWARRRPHPFTLGTVLLLTSFTKHCMGRTTEVVALAREILELSKEYSLYLTREGTIVSALARARGESLEDLEPLVESLEDYRTSGSRVFLPFYLSHLAEGHLRHHQPDQAAPLLFEALEISEASGERFWQAEIYRLQGRVAQSTNSGETEHFLRLSLQLARSQAGRSLELRTALDLADLLLEAGNSDEASVLLGNTLDGFVEDFDSPDLTRARRLLQRPTS